MLPTATEKVWNFLREQPALAGFVLAGGPALALIIRHRRSEDLDFVYPETRLPRKRLDALRRLASEAGFGFQHNDNEAAAQEFALGGMELHDHGFSIRDYQAAFQEAGSPAQCDTGLARLCSGVPQRDDEGYSDLLPDAPSLDEVTTFFRAQRDKLEVEAAAEAARRRRDKNE